MATTNDIKNGSVLDIDGQLWQVVEFQHVKPGKGGAFVRSKIKNVMTGKVIDRTFNAGVKINMTTIDRRDMQYLYNAGEDYYFMDNDTYEQISIDAKKIGEGKYYLLEGMTVTVASHDSEPLFIELPASVELTISHTEPGLKGDRSSSGTKPAEIETGKTIQVPLFINEGDKIKIDTRTNSYISRV